MYSGYQTNMNKTKVYIISKEKSLNIGYSLSHDEFRCKCAYADCTYTLVHPDLISVWNMVRAKFGAPLKVNSGYRCQRHNRNVGGVEDSRHKKGQAIDISFEGMEEKEKSYLKNILDISFDTVLVYDSFYHCHIE